MAATTSGGRSPARWAGTVSGAGLAPARWAGTVSGAGLAPARWAGTVTGAGCASVRWEGFPPFSFGLTRVLARAVSFAPYCSVFVEGARLSTATFPIECLAGSLAAGWPVQSLLMMRTRMGEPASVESYARVPQAPRTRVRFRVAGRGQCPVQWGGP